jgi:hypothetical protein
MINKDKIIELNDKFLDKSDEIINISSPYTFQNKRDGYVEYFRNLLKEYVRNSTIPIDTVEYKEGYYPEMLKDLPITLREAKKGFDFYPTPISCIEPIKDIIEKSYNILEPTAGIGHIINQIRKINKKAKLTAIEFTYFFRDVLKIFNPDITVNPEGINNFLKYNPDNVDYDLILINPPFTKGGDSRYYMDFLFHCLYLINRTNNIYEPKIIFISPDIVKNNKKANTFGLEDILTSELLSKKKLKEIVATYNLHPTDKEIDFLLTGNENIFKKENDLEKAQIFSEKFNELFDFPQGQFLGQCSGFGGTKAVANINLILGYNKEEPEKKINLNTDKTKFN